MILPEGLRAAVFAAFALIAADYSIWAWTRFSLSTDYEDAECWKVRRTFPNRWRFQIAKAVLGLSFIGLFVWAFRLGPADHTGLVASSLAILVSYFAVVSWESVKAFRHFAAGNFTPRGTGGYRQP